MRVLLLLAVCLPYILGSAIKPRIIGGKTANAGEFPFAAAIYTTTADGTYFFAGTLLNNDYVLTSARALLGAISFTIQLGSNTLAGNDANRRTVVTSTYIVHPDYNADTYANDVGLIKLRIPIEFTDYIKAVRLPNLGLPPAGYPTEALGWGQVSDEQAGLSNTLQYVTLEVLSDEECRSFYGVNIVENLICAAGNYNEGTCSGDIGSPLIVSFALWTYQVAIASFNSVNGCESSEPSGYTSIYPYIDWIRSQISETA